MNASDTFHWKNQIIIKEAVTPTKRFNIYIFKDKFKLKKIRRKKIVISQKY